MFLLACMFKWTFKTVLLPCILHIFFTVLPYGRYYRLKNAMAPRVFLSFSIAIQCCGTRGAVGGCLAQGSHLSCGIEGGESAGHSLPPLTIPAGPETRTHSSRLEHTTSGYKSDALSIRPRLPKQTSVHMCCYPSVWVPSAVLCILHPQCSYCFGRQIGVGPVWVGDIYWGVPGPVAQSTS